MCDPYVPSVTHLDVVLSRLSNGQINFERFWPVSECLSEFLVRKQQLVSLSNSDSTCVACSHQTLMHCLCSAH